MKALAISGGGGKIGFAAGVVYALDKKGIKPDYISGISSGSLVGIMTATGQLEEMKHLLTEEVTNDHVFKKRTFRYGLRFLKHKIGVQSPIQGFYDNSPLKELIHSYIHGKVMQCDYWAGIVEVNTNRFLNVRIPKGMVLAGRRYDNWLNSILASTAIPIIFPPVKMMGGLYVDAGLHHDTPFFPLKKAIQGKADEIIAVSMHHPSPPIQVKNDIDMAAYTIQTLISRAAEEELKKFEIINEIAKREGGQTTILGKTYYHYPSTIYRPSVPLNDSLDFDYRKIKKDFELGTQTGK